MNSKLLTTLMIFLLALWLPVSAFAISLQDAARRAAQQNDAKVLSAKTVQQGQNRVHEIKLLTRDGVVKTVRVPADS